MSAGPPGPDGRLGPDAVTWLTFYLVALFAIPSRLVLGPLGSAGAISMLVGLASFGLWALYRVGVVQSSRMRLHPVRIALVVFLISVGVSYALAMSRPISGDEISPADVAILSLLSWTGTMLIAYDGIDSRRRLDTLVWRVAVAGGLLAILGLAQFLASQAFIDRISIPGLTWLGDPAEVAVRNGLVRPAGTATHPIEYGVLITIILPLALYVAFHHRHRPVLVRWVPPLAIGAVIAISSSRSAYVGAAVALVICMFGWSAARRRGVLLLSLAGSILLFAVAPRMLRSISNLFLGVSEDPSIESRTGSFQVAWTFIGQDPLFGRGLGTFLPKYRIFDNQYLLLLVSVGIVGTVAFVLLAVVVTVQLLRLRRQVLDAETRELAVCLVAAVITGFVSLAFFDAFAFPMTMGTLFLILGISGAATRLLTPAQDRVDARSRWS